MVAGTRHYEPKVCKDQTATFPPLLYLDFDGVGNDPIHSGVREGVKVLVRPPHELRFQQVAAAPIVLEHPHVELHRQVWWGGTERRGEDTLRYTQIPSFNI